MDRQPLSIGITRPKVDRSQASAQRQPLSVNSTCQKVERSTQAKVKRQCLKVDSTYPKVERQPLKVDSTQAKVQCQRLLVDSTYPKVDHPWAKVQFHPLSVISTRRKVERQCPKVYSRSKTAPRLLPLQPLTPLLYRMRGRNQSKPPDYSVYRLTHYEAFPCGMPDRVQKSAVRDRKISDHFLAPVVMGLRPSICCISFTCAASVDSSAFFALRASISTCCS